MDNMTRGSVAKLLLQTEFFEVYRQETLSRIEQEVLNATDDELLNKRRELKGAKACFSQLEQILTEHMMRENPHLQQKLVTP